MRCDCGYDIQSGTAEESRTFFNFGETELGTILKAVARGAGLVCLLAPLTGLGVLVFVFALYVAIIAGVTGIHLAISITAGTGRHTPTLPVQGRYGRQAIGSSSRLAGECEQLIR